ncbi:MAG: NYN domain-containing protein [Planctomycetota bacterium]
MEEPPLEPIEADPPAVAPVGPVGPQSGPGLAGEDTPFDKRGPRRPPKPLRWPILNFDEDVEALSPPELVEKFHAMKREVQRLRLGLNQDPVTGKARNGGFTAPGGFLGRQTVAAFIDVQNMYYSAKRIFGSPLAYGKMLRYSLSNRRLSRAIGYVVEREDIDQEAFLDSLRRCGIEIRAKPAVERANGAKKAEWDLGMAADMVRAAGKVDVILIVSGNGVFADVVPILQAKGSKVECCSFAESLADLLRWSVDRYHLLNESHLYR